MGLHSDISHAPQLTLHIFTWDSHQTNLSTRQDFSHSVSFPRRKNNGIKPGKVKEKGKHITHTHTHTHTLLSNLYVFAT